MLSKTDYVDATNNAVLNTEIQNYRIMTDIAKENIQIKHNMHYVLEKKILF